MTKVRKKKIQKNMQSHIDKAFMIIDEFLPNPYVEKVLSKLPEPKPSKGYVRNVKMRLTPNHLKRTDIINALLEVSLEEKKEKLKLEKLVN